MRALRVGETGPNDSLSVERRLRRLVGVDGLCGDLEAGGD